MVNNVNYKYNFYCDMDGVLANFNAVPNAVKRFATEKDFFLNLKPIVSNVKMLNDLISNGYNVFILSASPNKRCDKDKIKWLKKYLPLLKNDNIIIIRNGQNKADFVKTEKYNILFDDFGENIKDFEEYSFNKGLQVKKYKTIKKLLKELDF